MNKKLFLILAFIVLAFPVFSSEYSVFWKERNAAQMTTAGTRYLFPTRSATYTFNTQAFIDAVRNLGYDVSGSRIISLPTPDGNLMKFRIWETQVMDSRLAERYTGIRTFSAMAVNNKGITAKLDITPKGFHAMVYNGGNTYFIDPYSNVNDGNYICYYKRDYVRTAMPAMTCGTVETEEQLAGSRISVPGQPTNGDILNGVTKKSYRLALACTAEYAAAVDGPTPTVPGVLAAMVTSINRVSGVYELEFAVSLQLIANTDLLIYLANPDPYTNSNGSTMLTENQNNVTAVIGSANYDIGHVFSTGGGGVANLQSVCNVNNKARGVTGLSNPMGDPFDIDYVAHEIGHQFGGSHTFNAGTGSCSGNGSSTSAYEPGSGTTIMAYAGICGINNLQPHSDPYFHTRSLEQMITFINGAGGACAATSVSGNTPPVIPPFQQLYNIPFLTPFELIAPQAVDIDHDTLTYCWEQWNRGDFPSNFTNTRLRGPIFRTFNPDTSRTRVFPRLDSLLNNVTSYLGEKLPDTSRWMTFRLTVRDVFNGTGCVNTSDDSISLNVVYTTTPFRVTYPDTTVAMVGDSQVVVTWDVSATDQAPISCTDVEILLSDDGGWTYPYVLKSTTPNDGIDTVTVPNLTTSTARIKIKGLNNVFFDISNYNSSITMSTNSVRNISADNQVRIYPVPASDKLTVETDNYHNSILTATNTIGQQILTTSFSKKAIIDVSEWSSGVYYFTVHQNGSKTVKRVVIQ